MHASAVRLDSGFAPPARPAMTRRGRAHSDDPPLRRLRQAARRARRPRRADAAGDGRHGFGRHHPAQSDAHRFPLGQRSLRIRPLPHDAAHRAVAAAPRPACADRSRPDARSATRRVADGGAGRRRGLRGLPDHDALRPQDDGRQRGARLHHHQEPGVSGVVAALAAAGLLCAAGRRIRVPLRPPDARAAADAAARRPRSDSAHGLGRGKHHPVRRPGRADEPRAVGRDRLPCHQHRRRVAVSGRRAGVVAARAQRRRLGDELFAHADPVLRADGRGAVSLRRGAESDRRLRAADPPGARPALGHRHRRRHRVLGDFRLDHRHHRAARQPDAADHAGPRLRQEVCHGSDHRHRRRRHADPAVGAGGAARQSRRHFDFRAF